MKRLSMDTLDALATQERKPLQRKRTSVSPKHERALRRYRGHDRSVDISGIIDPPVKNAAKTAFASANVMRNPRLNTATPVKSIGNVVSVPSKLGC